MLQEGFLLNERYQIKAPLGQGGFATVYRANDIRLNTEVAVKLMKPQPEIDPQLHQKLRKQFRQEAQILAKLQHNHVVTVLDYFTIDNHDCLVMNYVKGQSLESIIRQVGHVPTEQVYEWALQLLGALEYCHSQGVLHRDIKPDNIIIRENGDAVLVDFGLVKLWNPDEAPQLTTVVIRGARTLAYAPPEQDSYVRGTTDPRSDLYSLGATLYNAVTGRMPASPAERAARPDEFRTIQQLVPTVNKQLAAVVMQAMNLAQSKRFDSARAMLLALTHQEETRLISLPIFILSGVVILLLGLLLWGQFDARESEPVLLSTMMPTQTYAPIIESTLELYVVGTLTPEPTELELRVVDTLTPEPTETPHKPTLPPSETPILMAVTETATLVLTVSPVPTVNQTATTLAQSTRRAQQTQVEQATSAARVVVTQAVQTQVANAIKFAATQTAQVQAENAARFAATQTAQVQAENAARFAATQTAQAQAENAARFAATQTAQVQAANAARFAATQTAQAQAENAARFAATQTAQAQAENAARFAATQTAQAQAANATRSAVTTVPTLTWPPAIPTAPVVTCDSTDPTGDADNDGKSNGEENSIEGLDPCNPDSDGDGWEDNVDWCPTAPGPSGGNGCPGSNSVEPTSIPRTNTPPPP